MKTILVASALFFMISGPAFAGPECTCRYEGGDVAEGETVCMRTANGMTMARCEKVLNNTSWKFLGEECPQASLQRPRTLTDFKNDHSLSLGG